VEGFAVTIQDWVIKTRSYEKQCLGVDVENMIKWVKQLNSNSWVPTVYLVRHSQLAKIIHQQSAIKYKLFERNTPPYYT